jgi:YVTN family beta-propeller protein
MRFYLRMLGLVSLCFGSILCLSNAQSPEKVSGRGFLLVANKGDQTLGLVDPETNSQTGTVSEGSITGHEVAASPDGRTAYVPIYGNSGVGRPGTDGSSMVVIDITARTVIGNVDFGHGVRPHCAVFGPKNGLLYVTTELDHTVTVIDPRTLKILGTIPTGQAESHMLAITRDGRRGYTSNVGPGTVSVLDLEKQKIIAVIPISPVAQRISLSLDDSMAFTSDQTKPQLAVIDTSKNKVKTWVPLPAKGYGTAPTLDGRWLLVALPEVNKVAVVNLNTMKVARTIDVPSAPQEVLVRPDNKVAYVSCDVSHQIAVIDLSNWKVEKLVEAGKGADGLAWATSK